MNTYEVKYGHPDGTAWTEVEASSVKTERDFVLFFQTGSAPVLREVEEGASMSGARTRNAGGTVPSVAQRADGMPPPQFKPEALDILEHWIFEREAIRMRKEEMGKPRPWTEDPVLRDNRFCNVCRMDDKVSKWLLERWYAPLQNADARTIITMATLARHINWPDTLCELDQYVQPSTARKWHPAGVQRVLKQRQARGQKVFTGAYIINGARGGSKISQVVRTVDEVWKAYKFFGGTNSMESLHRMLTSTEGIGSFMAGQIVADLRFTPVLDQAYDAMIWAPRGPGSTRGMNRLLGRTVLHTSFTDASWQHHMTSLWRVMYARNRARVVLRSRHCELMDLQNCLCEFDKYVRVLNGEGRARNRYPGT